MMRLARSDEAGAHRELAATATIRLARMPPPEATIVTVAGTGSTFFSSSAITARNPLGRRVFNSAVVHDRSG